MPTEEKRINLTVHRMLYRDIVAFRDYYRKLNWWKSCSLSYVCCWIIKEYLREHSDWRGGC